jgi:hypothetical protein
MRQIYRIQTKANGNIGQSEANSSFALVGEVANKSKASYFAGQKTNEGGKGR